MRSSVGHYRIEGLIGRGGMGVVYRGVHDHLGRAVAIKELLEKRSRMEGRQDGDKRLPSACTLPILGVRR